MNTRIAKKPLVSIIITCYNYAEYLKEAVESALNQTYSNIEIVIINDGSTDESDSIGRELSELHKSIRYISQKNNGIIKTRNKGIAESRGDFIVFLDADDYLEKNYITAALEVASQKKVGVVYTDYIMFDAKNEESNFPEYSLEQLKNHNYIHMSSLLSRAAVGAHRFDEGMKELSHEDWDFFLSLCMDGVTAAKCTTTHLYYRIHHNGRNNRLESDKGRLDFAKVYLYITGKYLKNTSSSTAYLAGRIFADWYIYKSYDATGFNDALDQQNRKVKLLESSNAQLKAKLQDIEQTKYYRWYQRLRRIRHAMMRRSR